MPAASDPGPVALPRRFRPLGVRMAASAFGVVLVVVSGAIWWTFPAETRAEFTPFQRITLLLIGLLVFSLGYALGRCRVDADAEGVLVVNGYRTYRYDWRQVLAVTLRPGSPWAVLDLSDGTSRPAMGIQGSDGARAQQQVAELRALIEAHAAPEPPTA